MSGIMKRGKSLVKRGRGKFPYIASRLPLALAVSVLWLGPALGFGEPSPEPEGPFVTKQAALVCPRYGRLDAAVAAAAAGDKKWLEETGCSHVTGGLRLVPVDPRGLAGRHHRPEHQVRIYTPDRQQSWSVWIRQRDVQTWLHLGAFQTQAQAERRMADLRKRLGWRDVFVKSGERFGSAFHVYSGPVGLFFARDYCHSATDKIKGLRCTPLSGW